MAKTLSYSLLSIDQINNTGFNFASNFEIVFRGPKFGVVNLGFRYALREENGATSAVHPESPP